MASNILLEQRFREAWVAACSSLDQHRKEASPPQLECFDRRGRVTKSSLRAATSRCEEVIGRMEEKLYRKRFALGFMKDLLGGRIQIDGWSLCGSDSSEGPSDESDSDVGSDHQPISAAKGRRVPVRGSLYSNLQQPISKSAEHKTNNTNSKKADAQIGLQIDVAGHSKPAVKHSNNTDNTRNIGASNPKGEYGEHLGGKNQRSESIREARKDKLIESEKKDALVRTASEPLSQIMRKKAAGEKRKQTFSLRSSSPRDLATYRATLRDLANLEEDDGVSPRNSKEERLESAPEELGKNGKNSSGDSLTSKLENLTDTSRKCSDGLPEVGFKNISIKDNPKEDTQHKDDEQIRSASSRHPSAQKLKPAVSLKQKPTIELKPKSSDIRLKDDNENIITSKPVVSPTIEQTNNFTKAEETKSEEKPVSENILRRKQSSTKQKLSFSAENNSSDGPTLDDKIPVACYSVTKETGSKDSITKEAVAKEAVSKEAVADVSSGDEAEENLIALRESMCRSSQWCADGNTARQRLSQQALRLSNRFSRCYGDAAQAQALETGTMRTTQTLLDTLIEAPSTLDLSFISEREGWTGGLDQMLPPPTPATLHVDFMNSLVTTDSRNTFMPQSSTASTVTFSTAGQSPYSNKIEMRRIVIKSLLDSERNYMKILNKLLEYKNQTSKNFASTPPLAGSTQQRVVTTEEVETMFNGISELHKIHYQFIHDLEPLMQAQADPCMAEIFKIMAMHEYAVAAVYLQNYQQAVTTVRNCRQASPQFDEFTQNMTCPGLGERTNLEEMLHQPIIRFQRSTLVLHDLIKYTPTGHADYDLLQKTQKFAANFLENFGRLDDKEGEGSVIETDRHERFLAKEGLLVEKVSRCRKLRHIFLYNDLLVAAKLKQSNRQKVQYELKWFVPLIDLSLEDKINIQEGSVGRLDGDNTQEMQHSAEVEVIQKKVIALQKEYKQELKKYKTAAEQSKGKLRSPVTNKNVEKIRKKLMEQEAALFVAFPRLEFCVRHQKSQRHFLLMMSSDYERTDWRDTIIGLLSKLDIHAALPSAAEIQNLINKQQKLSMRSNIPFERDSGSLEEERLFGSLHVKVCRLVCLDRPANAYCHVEVDSFDLFSVKAKTKVIDRSMEPNWNADFELDLEGAQTIRFLCYDKQQQQQQQHQHQQPRHQLQLPGSADRNCVVAEPKLLGRGALELRNVWLKEDSHSYNVALSNNLSLVVVLEYFSREQTLSKYQTLERKTGVFGVPVEILTRREGNQIPLIMSSCVQEIEKRGLNEEGLYRISGMSTTIEELKLAFDKNVRQAVQKIKSCDVNVLTGLLKLYLRTLPDSLFTDSMYTSYVEAIGLADPDAKDGCLLSHVNSLPEPNYTTVLFFLDHLITVSKHEASNRMTLRNLATVFGPTMLRPLSSRQSQQTLSMEQLIFLSTHQAVQQSSILLHYLNLRSNNPQLFIPRNLSSI